MRRVAIVLAFLLSSCHVLPDSELFYQRDGGSYTLHTRWQGPAQQVLQQVTFTADGQRHEFLLSAQFDSTQILLVGLSPIGQELWRIALTPDGQLAATGIQPFANSRFAVQLLAQMQWSLLPLSDIQSHLRSLTLQQLSSQRQLKNSNGVTVLTIDGVGDIAVGNILRIHDSQFELSIETLEQELL